jgi:hypothetical protein
MKNRNSQGKRHLLVPSVAIYIKQHPGAGEFDVEYVGCEYGPHRHLKGQLKKI